MMIRAGPQAKERRSVSTTADSGLIGYLFRRPQWIMAILYKRATPAFFVAWGVGLAPHELNDKHAHACFLSEAANEFN